MIYGILDHHMISELVWEVNTWPPARKGSSSTSFLACSDLELVSANYRIADSQCFQDHSDCANLKDIAEVATLNTQTVPSGLEDLTVLALRGKIIEVNLSMETFEYWVESRRS